MSRRNIAGWSFFHGLSIMAWGLLGLSLPAQAEPAKAARIVTAKVVIPDCTQERLVPSQVSRQGASLDMASYQERDELAPEPMSRKLLRSQCAAGNAAPQKNTPQKTALVTADSKGRAGSLRR